MNQSQLRPSGMNGFTLIEILLVVVLLGVLLSIALPQYQRYLQRGHRVDAIRMLTGTAACLERHRTRMGTYDTSLCLDIIGNGYYHLSIEPVAMSSSDLFTVTAAPIEPDMGDYCGSLSLNQAGMQFITGPEDKRWKCWSGR
jgi:type IV pilus assembly protein PilE